MVFIWLPEKIIENPYSKLCPCTCAAYYNSLISHPHLKTLTKNNPIENKSHAEQVQSKNSIHKIPRVKFTCITATPPPERGTSYCTCNREQTRCLATDACNRLENGTVIVIGYMSCPGHDQHDLAEMGWMDSQACVTCTSRREEGSFEI